MEHINLFEQNKKRKIGYILLTILIATVFTLLPLLLSGCDFSDIFSETKGIEVKEEKLITSWEAIIGDNLFPILRVQIKNTSGSTKKVICNVNFYADGALLSSDSSTIVTLAPGDETYIYAQSNKGYRAWSTHEYSYKITGWTIY